MKRARAILSGSSVVVAFACAFGQFAGAAPYRGGTVPERDNDFCSSRVARDFLQPLARMASISRVPNSGRLPFAPRGLSLEARGGRLVVGAGWVGFGFSDEAIEQVRHLNWDVSARISEVDARGRVAIHLGSKRRRIGSIIGNRIDDFLFRVSDEPAYYRVDISFRRIGHDRVLGRFSNYVRVVRPRFDAKLLISGSVARQGEALSLRLANFGTEAISSISHDWNFAVHRFDGQEWIVAPGNPLPQKHKPIIRRLRAGQMGECIRFLVPASETPGLYRFSMVVNRNLVRGQSRRMQLTADFEITGRSLK